MNNILKIKNWDTIVDIISKASEIKEDEVFLEFPFWHSVLHNYLSLKIIKNKLERKKITIITTDIISKKIWKPLWINFIIKKDNKVINNSLGEAWVVNSIKESISKKYKEYFGYIKDTMINELKYSPYDRLKKRFIILVSTWLIFSLSMLAFIFYFAVNKTTIYIEPEIEIQNKAKNITFKEMSDWEFSTKENLIKLSKVISQISLTEEYNSSDIDYSSTKVAKWKIKVVNETFEEKKFLPKTRFVTPDWILFNSIDWEIIPPARISENWTKKNWETIIDIEAKVFDISWEFIWTRWNINPEEPIYLTLPWLINDKNKIYWILSEETSWWNNNHDFLISEKDIENAKIKLEEKLKKDGLDKIKEEIKEKNELNSTSFDLFLIKDIVSFNNIKIENVWDFKIWDKKNSFSLKWSLDIETYVYNKTELLNFLNKKINDLILVWVENISFINKNSINFINVIYDSRDNEEIEEGSPLEVKATTEIEVWITYNFNNEDNSRVKKIKLSILWMDKDKAKSIILNDPKINNVEIYNSPFFIKKISNLSKNINIEIKNN